jgi:hypothetical protein
MTQTSENSTEVKGKIAALGNGLEDISNGKVKMTIVGMHGICGHGGVSQDLPFPTAFGNIQCRLFSSLFPELTNLHV